MNNIIITIILALMIIYSIKILIDLIKFDIKIDELLKKYRKEKDFYDTFKS